MVVLRLRGTVGEISWVGVLEPVVGLGDHDWAGVEGVVVGGVIGLGGAPWVGLR